MKYPNKLYSVGESFVGKMVILKEHIPEEGIGIEDFYYTVSRKISVSDFIEALTCMYMVQSIRVTQEHVIYKVC